MSLIEDLKWRYATKKMNGESVPKEKLDYILEAARLAPSSSGLQPYRVFVITNKQLLEKIKVIANGQSQITDCSHLLVFASWDGYSSEKIGNVFSKTVKERGLPDDAMDNYKTMLWGAYEPLGTDWHSVHASKQAYIALGLAMVAAAEQKVDATPMEGFNNAQLDELLELNKYGLKSDLLLPLGYREENGDWLVKLKKYRTEGKEFVVELN